jgi:hypothetical protein
MTKMRKPPDPPIDDESDASPIDMRSLTFLGLWGGAAAAGLLVVAVATHTESGQRRLALAFSGGTAPVAAVEERRTTTRDAEIENRRLSDQLRNLSEDRDRLLARMTVLERNYEDVTGSIGRLANPPKPVLPELSPQASSALQAAPPPADVAPVASAPAMVPERGASPAPARPAPQAVAPQAAVPQAVAPEPIEGVSARTEFGVDLGGAPSVAALRNAWERIRRTHGVQLEGLRPVIGIRDGRTGQVELRLVVGPITNAGAAAKLCAALANAGLSCQPTTFDGQRLALR